MCRHDVNGIKMLLNNQRQICLPTNLSLYQYVNKRKLGCKNHEKNRKTVCIRRLSTVTGATSECQNAFQ